ncbi:MAG: DNA internalization-related competence protein ComEC/Rec2 [Lachnospiraceae bacterium]|nr:DNA internalization-related competence protein ComEC/Rec2 [Lachnospiraceae bacterium]
MRRILAFICVIFVFVCFIVLQTIKIPPPDFSAWEWEEISVIGKVVNKELRTLERGEILLVTIQPLGHAEAQNKAFKADGKIICYVNDLKNEPMMGSVVKMTGRLKAFDRATNPGQFGAEEFYQILKTDFRLYNAEIIAAAKKYSQYHEALYRLKKVFAKILDDSFSEVNAGTMRAMLLGERSQTDAELKALFQRNGIIHILTISGLHISIIGVGFYKLIRRIAVPIFLAAPLAIALMVSYGIMTNMSASSFRAIMMFALRMAAGVLKRSYDLLTALAIAAVLLLIEQPLYLYHSGFLFSFLAVLAIGLFVPVMKYKKIEPKPPDGKKPARFGPYNERLKVKYFRKYPGLRRISPLAKLKDAFLTCVMISVVTLPVYFIFYYEFPLFSIVLNIIIIPPMTFVVTGGIIVMTMGILSVPAAGIMAIIPGLILDFYELACTFFDNLAYNSLIVGKPESWQVVVYGLALLFIVFAHKMLKPGFRFLILLLAILVLLYRAPDGLTITFLDVGQGEAIFIATPDRRYYLIDGGSNTVDSVGDYRILPFLKSQGVSRLDGWFITHPHSDHYSAFPELAAKMDYGGIKINSLILPDIAADAKDDEFKNLENIAQAAGIKTVYIGRGQSIIADKKERIKFYCLNPVAPKALPNSSANEYSLSNEFSTVLLLNYGEFSLLLTGDVEGKGEREMEKHIADQNLAAGLTMLNVAHHGSRNSTSKEFLELTKPKYAIISAGYLNSYGHPHRDLMERLAEIGAMVYITYESGAITVKTNGAKMRIEEFMD